MARTNDRVVYERPHRPEAIPVVIGHPLDDFDMDLARRDPVKFKARMKRIMARMLADHIVEHCQVFQLPDLTQRNPVVRMAFSLHDEGGMRNWLPDERREGRTEGVKAVVEALPYGFDPASLRSDT